MNNLMLHLWLISSFHQYSVPSTMLGINFHLALITFLVYLIN